MKRCVKCFGECEDVFEVCPFCGSSMGCPAADGMRLSPGTLLKQRYFIGFAAGAGGFGTVYRAYDTILQRVLAVKEFFPKELAMRAADGRSVIAADTRCETVYESRKKRFIKEAQMLSGFAGNPAFPEVTDHFEENGTAYYVMEYLEGKTLAKKDALRPLDTDFALYAVAGAAAAVSLLHQKKTVHRDIAPDNLFVCAGTERPRVVLLDFGAAEGIFSRGDGGDSILKAGYSAPELYAGERASRESDVYSLGCTLYALLCGRAPLCAAERTETLFRPGEDALVSKALREVICKATDLSPQKRYPDAAAFLHALAKISPVAKEIEKNAASKKGQIVPKPEERSAPLADVSETRGITEALPIRLLPGTELGQRYSIGLDVSRCGVLLRYRGTDRVLRVPVFICEYFPEGLCERGADGVSVCKKGPEGAFDDSLALYKKAGECPDAPGTGTCTERFTDVFEENGTLYRITQDFGDIPLADSIRFRQGKKYSQKEVRALLRPLAAALREGGEAAAHGNILPETLCIGENCAVLRSAFALCYPASRGDTRVPVTPYSAPEAEGSQGATLAGDCYALGALAYRLLTGKAPMPAKERQGLKIRLGQDPLPAVGDCVRVPKPLAAGIDAALGLQPEGREKILEVL